MTPKNDDFPLIEVTEKSHAEVEYKKINPAFYKIIITDARKSYSLIFKHTYDPRWILRKKKEQISKNEVINNYANSWYLEEEGDYELELRYEFLPWNYL